MTQWHTSSTFCCLPRCYACPLFELLSGFKHLTGRGPSQLSPVGSEPYPPWGPGDRNMSYEPSHYPSEPFVGFWVLDDCFIFLWWVPLPMGYACSLLGQIETLEQEYVLSAWPLSCWSFFGIGWLILPPKMGSSLDGLRLLTGPNHLPPIQFQTATPLLSTKILTLLPRNIGL